jgi:hypothetical protein
VRAKTLRFAGNDLLGISDKERGAWWARTWR